MPVWPAGERLPLAGVPFAVKDNIDVEGMPTTAACPSFAYRPEHSSTVVKRLLAAGAVCVGKTNLDQFATGLVGTRSPYGAPRCVFNRDFVSGGSSSGSAVAVAAGLVAFALGTDTAGSGPGTRGVQWAGRTEADPGTLEHSGAGAGLSVPGLHLRSSPAASNDAALVDAVVAGFDAADPYSRHPLAAPATAQRLALRRAAT